MLFTSDYHAKLLLSAEYLVLNGAKALAVPLRFGQKLSVQDTDTGYISWQSVADNGAIWFSGKYTYNNFSILECSNPDIAKYPLRLMLAARKFNPDFCINSGGSHVVSTLNYPLLWGLGSSSTLIAAVAGWAEIDPFMLHFEVSKGSGYDIACALSSGPLLYALREGKPVIKPVSFSPSFADKIYFVYQGKKQDSAEGINKYFSRNSNPDRKTVEAASTLTNSMVDATTLDEFEKVLHEHEILISSLLAIKSIRNSKFSDLPGEVKSLGAWGGDFCMLTWRDDPALLKDYLKSKGLDIWFNFHDIVL